MSDSVKRIESLREQLYALDGAVRHSQREGIIREWLGRTGSEPWPILRAKAFKEILEKTEPLIFDDELIVGSVMGLFPVDEAGTSAAGLYDEAKGHMLKVRDSGTRVESGRELMEHDFNYLGARVGFEELRSLSQQLARRDGAELGFTYGQIFSELQGYFMQEPEVRLLSQRFFHGPREQEGPLWTCANHVAVDYEKVLRKGYGGLVTEVEERLARSDRESKTFYEAAIISLRAVMDFISRYADEAAKLARESEGAERKKELERISAILRHVSAEPARDFREALQLFWMTHVCLGLAGGIALAAGRFDQYMNPFCKEDFDAGRIGKEEAAELLACLWLKFNEPKLGAVQNLTIGGVTPGGEDGTNELSYLCLEAARRAKVPYPNLSARVHKNTPELFWNEIAETMRLGMGFPSVFNDDVLVPALCKAGFELQDARDYYVMGCQEIMISKKQPSWDVSYGFNLARSLAKVIEAAGKDGGFASFGALLEAYKTQIESEIRGVVAHADGKYRLVFERGADPFGSALLEDCLARGKDMYQRGTKYPATIGMWALGLATAADSLAAVRKLAFEDEALTLEELGRILESDFEADEPLRQFLLNRLAKFGNDDDGVDLLAKEIAEFFCREVLKRRGPHGEVFLPLLASYVNHVNAGESTGATPDGRKSGEPISDAASPAQGRDLKGPTAVLRSAAKIDYTLAAGGVALNIKFTPGTLGGEKGLSNFRALLKAYFDAGGQEIQVNVVKRSTLIDAKAHPERHRGLVVRVAGFNEYFVKLDSKLQDEIIARSEH